MLLSFELLNENDIGQTAIFGTSNIRGFLSEKHNLAFSAKLDGDIIGLLYGYSLIRMDNAKPQFFIYSVDIHEAYQNKGYGSKFIKYVLDWAKNEGFSESYVFTHKDNPQACRAYEKAGMTHSENDCERMYEVRI
ncbi:MAG: GNAT family N-acetyltransferase [Defluviitaleaceae bacterium]|nr:GNAT family N-acetyltransferase [Defluviitaleaceae bacterium]